MPVVVEYVGKVPWVTEAEMPQAIADLWKERLKASNDLIYQRLLSKIPDEETFIKLLAKPSNERYADFVNPNYPKSDFIILKQGIKLMGSYSYWKAGIDKAFGGEKPTYFQQQVDAKADKFKRAVYTLSAVGVRAGLFSVDGYKVFWGPGVKAVLLFTNDRRVVNYMDPNYDSFQAGPYPVIDPDLANVVRPKLIAIITQGVVIAQWANWAERTDVIPSIVSATNQVLQKALNGQLASDINADPNVTYIKLEYDSNTNTLSVHAHAETVTG